MKRLRQLRPPPRALPWTVFAKAYFGGVSQLVGWIFLTVGLVPIFYLLLSPLYLQELYRDGEFRGDIAKTSGKVTSAHGDTKGRVPVVEHGVEYGVEYQVDGVGFTNRCHVTGWQYYVGDDVQVEYVRSNPGVGRIVGSSCTGDSLWLATLFVAFAAVGALVLATELKPSRRRVQLLKHGHLTHGTLVSKVETGATVKDREVCDLTFTFRDTSSDREFLTTIRTELPEKIEDEKYEPLLYLDSCPEEAVLLDTFPCPPTLNSRGHLVDPKPWSVVFYLFLPSLGFLCAVASAVKLFLLLVAFAA